MTQDDIVVMAVNAGLVKWEVLAYKNELERFAKLVAAKEREACAELCDSEKKWWDGVSHSEKDIYQAIDNISALIRAKGEA